MHADFQWFDGETGRVSLGLPAECVADCAHAGRCDDDVAHWAAVPFVRGQLALFAREELEYALRPYGAWSVDELQSTPRDILAQRILWIAACDCADSPDTFLIEAEGAEHAQ